MSEPTWRIIRGDCVEVMKTLPAASVDAMVCDPPYGLEFMGNDWDAPWKDTNVFADLTKSGGHQDGNGGNAYSQSRVTLDTDPKKYQAWTERWGREAIRVLKPGGHALVFGGTRTYHRQTAGLEDAGFEVRDCIEYLYISGFPKSHRVDVDIDEKLGVIGQRGVLTHTTGGMAGPSTGASLSFEKEGRQYDTNPVSDLAKKYRGYGTAIKPAHEPILVARKPLDGTVAETVMKWGTGALNIDGCRVGYTPGDDRHTKPTKNGQAITAYNASLQPAGNRQLGGEADWTGSPVGRWPPNVVVTHAPDCTEEKCIPGCPVVEIDRQTGEVGGGQGRPTYKAYPGQGSSFNFRGAHPEANTYNDSGGGSRTVPQFRWTEADYGFYYCPKVSRAEREAGCESLPVKPAGGMQGCRDGTFPNQDGTMAEPVVARNSHPTAKPVTLMAWLCRLVTPPGGTVLDPFNGSGSTGIGALMEGFNYIGIEREPEYADIAEARLTYWAKKATEKRNAAEDRSTKLTEQW